MGMRRSDATFLQREVLPLLAQVAPVSPRAQDVVGLLEERLQDVDPAGSSPGGSYEFNRWFHTVSGSRENPRQDSDFDSWHVTLSVDSHEIPYIHGHWFEFGERAGAVHLILDRRFGMDTTDDELSRWAPFLANAMAVSAGRTSHGSHSRPMNRHGANWFFEADSGPHGTPMTEGPGWEAVQDGKAGCLPGCEIESGPHSGPCMRLVQRPPG